MTVVANGHDYNEDGPSGSGVSGGHSGKIYLSMFLGILSVCPFPEMKVILLRRAVMMMVKNLVIIVQL